MMNRAAHSTVNLAKAPSKQPTATQKLESEQNACGREEVARLGGGRREGEEPMQQNDNKIK